MQFFFVTRGIGKDTRDFIEQLNAKFVPMDYRDKDGNKVPNMQYRLAVRPIQAWEIDFPKEWRDVVLTTVLGRNDFPLEGNDGKKPVVHSWAKKYIYMFQKLLHLKPIPKFDTSKFLPIERNVQVVGLGIKDDYIMPNGMEGL